MDSNFIIKELKSKKLNKLCTGHRIETERTTFEYSSSMCQDTCPLFHPLEILHDEGREDNGMINGLYARGYALVIIGSSSKKRDN